MPDLHAVRIQDTLINLAHVTAVIFRENNPETDHDDSLTIHFATTGGSPLEITGEDAKPAYEILREAMKCS